MKNLLLLPDYCQSGEIMAWSNEMTAPTSISCCNDFPLRELPDCFILGVPESVLREHVEPDFVYAQYARLVSNRDVISYSIRGGNDKSGRTVFLTFIQILTKGQPVMFPPDISISLPSSIGEKELIEKRIDAMNRSMKADRDSNIHKMISAVLNNKKVCSFSSEYSHILANQPKWTPSKKKDYRYIAVVQIVVSVVTTALLAYLYIHTD